MDIRKLSLPERIFAIKGLKAVVALVHTISMCPEMKFCCLTYNNQGIFMVPYLMWRNKTKPLVNFLWQVLHWNWWELDIKYQKEIEPNQKHRVAMEQFGHLERFLSSVISHMIIENISSVKRLGAIRALEFFLLHVCLDVPFQDLNLGELFFAELTGKRFHQTFTLFLLLLILQLFIVQVLSYLNGWTSELNHLWMKSVTSLNELILLIISCLKWECLHLLSFSWNWRVLFLYQ